MTKEKSWFNLLVLGLLFLLCFGVIWSFLRPGYFPSHDGEWAIVRLAEMHREMKDLQFPPRWAGFLNHGFGYPLFLFTYPLPYYLGEIIHLLGFGLVNSVKIVFILSVFLSALTMFLLGKKLWGNLGGLVSATFYLYLPWRLVDLYVRGSIGESWAFVFYPLLFWLGINLMEKRTRRWAIFTAMALAGLILTHNVMALLFIPFWFIFMIFWSVKVKSFLTTWYLLFSILLGFSLSAFFWLPALLEKQYVVVGHMAIANIWQHFVSLPQFILPSWGYGLPGQAGAFSFQIGWVHILGFMLGLFFLRKQKKIFWLLLLGTLALIILMLPISYIFWYDVPLYSTIDFPWRLLGILGFMVSLAVGAMMTSRLGKYLAIPLAILVILLNLDYAKPASFFDRDDSYYATNDATTTSFDELMPTWVKLKPTNRPQEIIFNQDSLKYDFHLYEDRSNRIAFTVSAFPETIAYLNKIYFPGWQVKIDGEKIPLNFENQSGLISFLLPSGRHKIEVDFQKTLVRQLADTLSLLSLILIVTFFILSFLKTSIWGRLKLKTSWFVILTALLAIGLRLLQFKERFVFDYDQETALVAINQIFEKKIVLIGQEISVGGIFIGPFYYYFLTPFYWLSEFNPFSLVLANLLISLGAILSIFFLGKVLFHKTVGILAGFLMAISFPVVIYDQTAAPSNPLMLLTILFFLCLYKFLHGATPFLIGISFLLGLSLHLHPSALPLFLIFGLLFLQQKPSKISVKLAFLSLAIFLLTISPLLVFDLRHNFLNFKGFLVFLQGEKAPFSPFLQFFWLLKLNLDNFNDFFFYSLTIFKIISSLLLVLFFWLIFKLRQGEKILFKMISAWFFLPLLFFSFYRGHIPQYYLLITFPLLLIIFAFWLNYFWQKNELLKFWGIFLLILILSINLLKNFSFKNPFSLKYKEAAVDYILTDSQGNPGTISLATEKGLGYGYQFLFRHKNKPIESFSGANIYTIVAPWDFLDGPYERYFGAIKVIKRR